MHILKLIVEQNIKNLNLQQQKNIDTIEKKLL